MYSPRTAFKNPSAKGLLLATTLLAMHCSAAFAVTNSPLTPVIDKQQRQACCSHIAVISGPPDANVDDEWTIYSNPRFGTQIEYPARIFKTATYSQNGDGVLFANADGTSLRIWGSLNALDHNAAEYEHFLKSARPERYKALSLDRNNGHRLTLSGKTNGTIFYERYLFDDTSPTIHGFIIEYPENEKKRFDPVVNRLVRTFSWSGTSQ